MSGHTPGPWIVSIDMRDGYKDSMVFPARVGRKPVTTALNEPIARIPHDDITEAGVVEMEANARLIAAAPDLLAVVQDLQESAAYWSEYDVPIGIVDRINAAVAKATGGVES